MIPSKYIFIYFLNVFLNVFLSLFLSLMKLFIISDMELNINESNPLNKKNVIFAC